MLWASLQYLKCIRWLSFACFEIEIISVEHIGFGCPATCPKSCTTWPFYAIFFLPPFFISKSFSVFIESRCWVISYQCPETASSKLPYSEFFVKVLTCGVWFPPADNIVPKGKTGIQSDTMCYEREYIPSHIGDIHVLLVHFLSVDATCRWYAVSKLYC